MGGTLYIIALSWLVCEATILPGSESFAGPQPGRTTAPPPPTKGKNKKLVYVELKSGVDDIDAVRDLYVDSGVDESNDSNEANDANEAGPLPHSTPDPEEWSNDFSVNEKPAEADSLIVNLRKFVRDLDFSGDLSSSRHKSAMAESPIASTTTLSPVGVRENDGAFHNRP